MVRCLIIDDEALARQRIRRLLDDHPDVEVLGECRSGEEAIADIRKKRPELIFLDIQMKDMTGFEVLDALRPEEIPLTIFVTAYDQYAIRAFDIFAFDYLLKPFKEERFELSLRKALENLRDRPAALPRPDSMKDLLYFLRRELSGAGDRPPLPSSVIPIRQSGKISFVDPADISYIEASGYYIEIHTAEKKFLLRESMGNMEERLDPARFVRVHRSTIINLNFLEEIQQAGNGDVEVCMKTGQIFRVSRSYRDDLFQRLGV